ncbi:hypothetical protein VCHENC02_1378B, partial [Vibrio harveyi]
IEQTTPYAESSLVTHIQNTS